MATDAAHLPEDFATRQAILDTCRQMNALGINQGTSGNVSARCGDGFLISPSGLPYERMTPADVVPMDLDGGYAGPRLPSSEWRLHHDLLRARPEVGAVVHAHPTYATALSCLQREIPPFHYMVAVAGGPTIPCAAYATFGTRALSEAMLAAIAARSACLLANHGLVCCGPTLEKALWLAVEVETLARQYWAACQLGEPTLLSEAEMARVLDKMRGYGKPPEELPEGTAPAVEAPARRD
jgi:L-fuculose-phosphate aldolase